MTEKKILKNRSIFLLATFVILSVVLLGQLIGPSFAKYIKTEKDKIVAYYTALYLDSDGDGKTVSIENSTGYLNFKLMNYIGEDVTKRDIVYDIHAPETFYDKSGNILTGNQIKEHAEDPNKGIYVLDVWGTPIRIGSDTYKYQQSIIKTDAEEKEIKYEGVLKKFDAFLFEELGSSAVGKIHNITVQLKRDSSTAFDKSGIEDVSIVVHLIQPYEEVFVIDITSSEKLIVFSNSSVDMFEIPFERLFVQTANIFSHVKGTSNERIYYDKTNINTSYKMTSRGFKLELYWENMMLDEKHLNAIHLKHIGDADNVDMTKPYIISLDSDNNKLVLYVPEASNFYLDFLVIDTEKTVKVEANVYAYVLKGEKAEGASEFTYGLVPLEVQYTQDTFFGYDYVDNKYTIFEK